MTPNPRKWWSLSKKLLRNKSVSIPSLNVDNNIISGDIEKAEAFNHYFVQCSTLDDSQAVLPSEFAMLKSVYYNLTLQRHLDLMELVPNF